MQVKVQVLGSKAHLNRAAAVVADKPHACLWGVWRTSSVGSGLFAFTLENKFSKRKKSLQNNWLEIFLFSGDNLT